MIRLQRDLSAATATASELTGRLEQVKQALDSTPGAPADAKQKVRTLIARHRETVRALSGDSFLSSRWENTPPSIAERVGNAAAATRTIVDKPTGTQREQFKIAREELDREAASLRKTVEKDLKELEDVLDKIGAPWTPGRLPVVKDKSRVIRTESAASCPKGSGSPPGLGCAAAAFLTSFSSSFMCSLNFGLPSTADEQLNQSLNF